MDAVYRSEDVVEHDHGVAAARKFGDGQPQTEAQSVQMRFAEICLGRDVSDALEAANLKQRSFLVFVQEKLIETQRLVWTDQRVKSVGFVADFGQPALDERDPLAPDDIESALQPVS